MLRAIELYKGKPVFYSLGDFIFENETLLRLPSDNYDTFDLGPDAHVNDFNDARYDRDKSGFRPTGSFGQRSSPPRSSAAINSWSSRCIRSRSASANRAAPRPPAVRGG